MPVRRLGSRTLVPFSPPSWASPLRAAPSARLPLGHFPTPLDRWDPVGGAAASDREFWLKRDDHTGMELSGNKVRKLEFLLADALQEQADCVVTIGGLQSNHCRAVAVASRPLDLDSHLILRVEDGSIQDAGPVCHDENMTGNLLLNRMVGAQLWLVTRKEYRQHGSRALIERVCDQVRSRGGRPYAIPVGGSNPRGTWGYISAFEELCQQMREALPQGEAFSDIVVATGSGSTLAGIALANRLSGMNARIWGFGACDSPSWFYDFIDRELLIPLLPKDGGGPLASLRSRDLAEVRDAKNLGYAASAPEELETLREVALRTGVLFDPVYTGKALHQFLRLLQSSPQAFGRRVLFWHTGGLFGLWAKSAQLEALIREQNVGETPDVAPLFR